MQERGICGPCTSSEPELEGCNMEGSAPAVTTDLLPKENMTKEEAALTARALTYMDLPPPNQLSDTPTPGSVLEDITLQQPLHWLPNDSLLLGQGPEQPTWLLCQVSIHPEETPKNLAKLGHTPWVLIWMKPSTYKTARPGDTLIPQAIKAVTLTPLSKGSSICFPEPKKDTEAPVGVAVPYPKGSVPSLTPAFEGLAGDKFLNVMDTSGAPDKKEDKGTEAVKTTLAHLEPPGTTPPQE